MQRIRVNAYEVGLVFRLGALEQVLRSGTYWIGWGRTVERYNMMQPFLPGTELDILLRNERLRSLLDVIEIKDNEIGLHFQAGNFYKILRPGRHAYWKDVLDYSYEIHDMNSTEIPKDLSRKVLHNPQLASFVNIQLVEAQEKGLLFIDGNFEKELSPGVYYFWKNDRLVKILKTDLRKQLLEVSGQELLTKDKAAVRMSFYADYQVVDIRKAMLDTKDFAKQLYIQLQLALRTFIGTQTLDMLLANKDAIAPQIIEAVRAKVSEIGIQISGAGIRDIILPGEVKEIMNQVLIAEKKAQANVIMRREETASTRSLLNTAKLMENNEMLYRLKEMEFIEKIAENIEAISLNGGNGVIEELKGIFGSK